MDPYGRYHPAVPGQPPHVSGHERVGTAQRTIVLELLSKAVGEGYLDLDEYEARVVRVTEGRTVAALLVVVADLPAHLRWDPAQSMPRSRHDRQRESAATYALAGLALGAASLPLSLCFGAGGIAGVIAVVFARMGMQHEESRSKAVTGLVLGIVGIAVSIAVVFATIFT